jgi:hypothetical protein
VIVEFLAAKEVTDLPPWLATIEATKALGRVGPMKLLASELTAMANATLRSGDREALEHELERAFGPEVVKERKQARAAIQAILARGKITSESEYRVLRAYLDQVEGDTSEPEVDKVRDIIQQFEIGS